MSIKVLGKQSLIYGIGHVMARLITFLLLPLYTHSFSQEEYGALSLAYAFMGFALILYRYGMDTALMKYSVQTDGDERTKYISIIIFSQLVTSFFFSAVLYISRYQIAELVLGTNRPDWISSLALILFLDSLWNLPLLILRSEEKAIPFIGFSILNVVTTMIFNILFVVKWELGIEGVFMANIIASSIILIFSIPILYNRVQLRAFDKIIFTKILNFSLPFLPAGVFTMIMELSDRYLIEWFLGTADVGLYSAGKKMGMLGLTVVMGFNMGWTPYFLRRGKEISSRLEFAKITTLFIGFLGYVSLLVSIWLPEIMRIKIGGATLIGPEFWSCDKVVSAILPGYFFFGTYVVQLPGVYIKEITSWVPIFRIIGAGTLIGASILLIPKFGIVGAAYGVAIAFAVMSASIYYKTHRIYKVPYNWQGIIFPMIFLLGIQVNLIDSWQRVAISGLFPIFWYALAITKEEREGIKRVFK